MSIETARQRFTDLLDGKGEVTTKDLENDIVLASESPSDLNAAADLIEASGKAFVFRETGGPPGVGFTSVKAKS